MTKTRLNRRTGSNAGPDANLCTKNPTLTGLELNPGHRMERSESNHLRYGTIQTSKGELLSVLFTWNESNALHVVSLHHYLLHRNSKCAPPFLFKLSL